MKNIKLIPFINSEKTALKSLSLVVGLRMLGLFMLLPVLALYADEFRNSTPTLIGIAIGIYGLTQAILQIPFGMASDKIGRKKVIVFGLIIFALGSVIAAQAESISTLIIGRALQGSGAISAVSMALLADLTREEVRVRAMASIGITIGFSFIIAIVLGPLLNSFIGVSGIFWLTAVLAILAIALVIFLVPRPIIGQTHSDAQTNLGQLSKVVKNIELLRLDFGVFALHMALTAIFVSIPHLLQNQLNLEAEWHGLLYLAVMIISVVIMLPMVIIAEAKNKMKPIFVAAVALLALSQLGFYFLANSLMLMAALLIVFFVAFNVLESVLPSLISKTAPVNAKGTAMGVYGSSQFFGAFVGGVLGGWLIEQSQDFHSSFLLTFVILSIWFLVSFFMKKPSSLGTMLINVGIINQMSANDLSKKLIAIKGVEEVVISPEEGVAFVRINNKTIDRNKLLVYSKNKFD